jgi:hypothetical protein
MTYKDDCWNLLNDRSALRNDAHRLAAAVGCAYNTARHYLAVWHHEQETKFALDRIVPTGSCDTCPVRALCEQQVRMGLYLLCAKVTNDELLQAELMGLGDALRQGRARAALCSDGIG